MASALVGVTGTLAAAVLALSPAGFAGAATAARSVNPNTDAAGGATVDSGSALVQLSLAPLSTSTKTRPAKGKKIDFNNSVTKSERARLAAQRNDFKQWLQANAPKAKVSGEWDISLNAVAVRLNGTTLGALRAAPNVAKVEYEGLYHPSSADPDLSIINAEQAWSSNGGSAASAGRGVKVAIIDTGIDVSHPCFNDTGYPATTQLGDKRYTNNKVIVARVFNNKIHQGSYTAEALQEHGTHVAGTVACNYNTPAAVEGVTIPYGMSGVAPAAQLGSYNIFPGAVDDARSEDILNALDAAYADGMDVANMSLGGGAHGVQDLLTHAVDDLDVANMVVAIAAGNSGPGHYTVESPGSGARALSAGAATVGHFVGAPVHATGSSSYGAAVGDFATVAADLTAPLAVTTGDGVSGLNKACTAFPANSLTGKIALINRGDCDFTVKIGNAQAAGAVAALVVNNVAGDPTAMGSNGDPDQPTIPAYSLAKTAGEALKAYNGVSTTIGKALQYFATGNDNIMAGFSSQGPTDVDFRVKPDVVAPGVNVLSSIPHQFCDHAPCFAFFQGTSMATPHLAGSAAVLKGAHPTWSAAQIRSAIVNTATQGVLLDSKTGSKAVTDANITGAGLENLLAATNAQLAIEPVSVSFGSFPVGSGQSRSATVVVSDLTGHGGTYPVSVSAGGDGVTFGASTASITIPAGGSASFTVSLTSVKGAALADHQATLTVGGSHAVLYAFGK